VRLWGAKKYCNVRISAGESGVAGRKVWECLLSLLVWVSEGG